MNRGGLNSVASFSIDMDHRDTHGTGSYRFDVDVFV